MDNIQVPVSPGETLDKITILEIKMERLDDEAKRLNVRIELQLLTDAWDKAVNQDAVIADLRRKLKRTNETLWEIEDDIRDKERDQEFDQAFIELARQVYLTNDRRSGVKKAINVHLGSQIMEEKSYQAY